MSIVYRLNLRHASIIVGMMFVFTILCSSCASSVRFSSAGGIDYRLLATTKPTSAVHTTPVPRESTVSGSFSSAAVFGASGTQAGSAERRRTEENAVLEPTDVVFFGNASYYGDEFQGRRTANGERYDGADFSAAHRTLPFGTMVKVKHVNTDRSVIVRVNDRGPFKDSRIIDLSKAAAEELGLIREGTGMVEVVVMK